MSNELKEKCGVFGIYGDDRAAEIVLQGLKALQHRGQDSAGIAGYSDLHPNRIAGLGRVENVFPEDNLRGLKADRAIGQVRYTTSSGLSLEHAQPVDVDIGFDEKLYLGHNGNVPSTRSLERLMDSKGISHDYFNDSEMIAHSIGYFLRGGASLPDAFREIVPYIPGVYSLVMITSGQMAAARCENGVKPDSIGIRGQNYVVASETCALDAVEAEYLRDVVPGEFITFDDNGMTAYKICDPKYKLCIFETIYFASPKSYLYGRLVEDYRIDYGRMLAKENQISADMILPLLQSGLYGSIGFSEVSGIPIMPGLEINNGIDRTFITAGISDRRDKAESKYKANMDLVSGKDVITIDDSQVHGTTDLVTVRKLREAGARRIIVLKASPVYKYPNFYGTNTSVQSELASSGRTVDQIRQWIGADDLGFLSLEGLKSTLGEYRDNFDFCVFDGVYPVPIGERASEIVYPEKELTHA